MRALSAKDNEEDYNKQFTYKELDLVISKLPYTSLGPDMIHAIFIKNLNQTWKKSLLDIINQALSVGIYPRLWEKGEAIMIPKWERIALS